MNKEDMKLFFKDLNRAEVVINNVENEVIISYNGYKDPATLNQSLLDLQIEIDLNLYQDFEDTHTVNSFLNHFSDNYVEHIDELFPTVNNLTTHSSLIIDHNTKGTVRFSDLNNELQLRVSEFASTQKERLKFMLGSFNFKGMDTSPSTNSQFKYTYQSSTTNLVCELYALYISNHFIPQDDYSNDKFSSFANQMCDQLGIPRVTNLSAVLSNIKRKVNPTETLDILKRNLLESLKDI